MGEMHRRGLVLSASLPALVRTCSLLPWVEEEERQRERKEKKKGKEKKEKKWDFFSNMEISWKKNKRHFIKLV
jgi:hypothetical protein